MPWPYATLAHVSAQDSLRDYSATSRPTASQVVGFLEHTAAEIDGLLRARGYSLPVGTGASSALKLLEHANALGAAAMVAQSATNPGGKKSSAEQLWESIKRALKSGDIELDADKDSTRSFVRHNTTATAMFYLGQDT